MHILIVDENKAVREFCKNSIQLFFNFNGNLIETAGNGFEAIEILKRFKIQGKQCGLVICDTDLSGISGFEIVNELYNRNYNAQVILTRDEKTRSAAPRDFKGLREIIPEHAVVKKIIAKPFHSQTFIDAIKSMDINTLSGAYL
jgi:CheY-like chemotaxis protein